MRGNFDTSILYPHILYPSFLTMPHTLIADPVFVFPKQSHKSPSNYIVLHHPLHSSEMCQIFILHQKKEVPKWIPLFTLH
mgnify:CR=1 FL=1